MEGETFDHRKPPSEGERSHRNGLAKEIKAKLLSLTPRVR